MKKPLIIIVAAVLLISAGFIALNLLDRQIIDPGSINTFSSLQSSQSVETIKTYSTRLLIGQVFGFINI